MALLIVFALVTMYAIVLTVFHMKQQKEVEELREDNSYADRELTYYRGKVIVLERKLTRAQENAEADWIACKANEKKLEKTIKETARVNERLIQINNKLMERIKRVTP